MRGVKREEEEGGCDDEGWEEEGCEEGGCEEEEGWGVECEDEAVHDPAQAVNVCVFVTCAVLVT